jgi:hypothetical protein
MWIWLWAKGPKMKKRPIISMSMGGENSAAMLDEARAAA